MNSTGIVRKLDNVGRIVIPMEVRKCFGIAEKDGLEIFTDKEQIILRKYDPACVFCGRAETTTEYKGKKICAECAASLLGKRS